MKNRRAFVFSIDAFVAFSLALLALYSLVFFSAIPFTYYSSLMQAHILANDALYTLMNSPSPNSELSYRTALGYLVYINNNNMAYEYLRTYLIPKEYDFLLEIQEGSGWREITTSTPDDYSYNKLKATSYAVLYDFSEPPDRLNHFGYITCTLDNKKPCPTDSSYSPGSFRIVLVRLSVYA